MLRSFSILVLAIVALLLPGASRGAVTVFQDPSCNLPGCTVGTPGAPAVPITTVTPATVALNLFYQTGTVPSSIPADRCQSGNGDEVCGWDIHVSTTNPNVLLQSFVTDTGPGSDIVAAITGNVLRLNGGVVTIGELGIHRLGTLYVTRSNPSATGSVTVAGNLYVTTQLAAAPVTTGNTLAIATGGISDVDGDSVDDSVDNCPTVANTSQADGNTGLEIPADGVGDACDNCLNVNNPRVPGWTFALGSSEYVASNPWATLTGDQRDDDHDGYGNICDGDFGNNGSTTAADTAQFKASIGDLKASDVCGTALDRPCAIFDINATNSTESSAGGITAADTARYKLLIGAAPGPSCAACTGTGSVPLPCVAGSAGACN